MAEKEDNRFDEQAFLLDFFEETVDANANHGYSQFIQLTGDPTGVVNKISSLGAGGFLKFKTHQLALLVPQVRIIKVYHEGKNKKSEQEFRFDDYTTIESITQSRGRGSDAGLVSFAWNDMGTNPGDSGLSFEATLKLKFQSFEALFKDRGGYKFADLVVPAKGKSRKSESTSLGGKKIYNDKYFQIKAIVGWAEPNDPGRKVFSSDELKMIRNLKTTFLLTLTTHDLDIQEDGSFDLTLSFMAAIEGRILSSRADLLYVEASSGLTENILNLKKQILQTKRLRADRRRTNAGLPDEEIGLADTVFGVFNTMLGGGTTSVKKAAAAELEAQTKKIQEKQDRLDKIQHDARTKSYQRLLNKIEQGNRIFYFDLTQGQVEMYNLLAEELSLIDEKDPARKAEEVYRKRIFRKQEIKNLKPGSIQANQSSAKPAHKVLTTLNNDLAKMKESGEDLKKARDERIKEFEKKQKEKQTVEGTLSLNFIYLGDLINAGLEILAERKIVEEDGVDDALSQFRFLLGTIELAGSNGKLRSVPLSDIPISLNVFQSWFVKNVVKPMRDHLPFRTFVKRVLAELVVSALSPHGYGPKGKSSKTRISLTTQTLGKNSFRQGRATVGAGRFSIANLKKNLRQQANLKDIKNLHQFLFLYVGGVVSSRLRGDRASDEDDLGIYHFFVGADQGIIKKITFKRTDLPFQRESRIASAQNEAQGNLLFSDFYNAEITMIGNSIFRPGLLIYIDPRSMGLGSATSPASEANLLGIGGYYMVTKVENSIESGKFESSMSLISETSARDLQKKDSSTMSDQRRKEILSTPGGVDSMGRRPT